MIMPLSLPSDMEKILRSELNFDEKLLWSGQPIPGRSGRGSWGLVLFGIPWTAFSIFWVAMAISMTFKAPSPFPFVLFPLFGVPFVLIGLGLLSAPYWMRLKAQKTVYALTDKRGLILSSGFRGAVSVRSIQPEILAVRERTQNPDGSGTIIFPRLTVMRRAAGPDGGTYAVNTGFENISNVRDVDTLIERTYRTEERDALSQGRG